MAALQLAVTPLCSVAQTGAANSKKLDWTAPGDDGSLGRASRYELHYSTSAISDAADSTALDAWWSSQSSPVPGMPLPSQSGAIDSVRVNNLTYGTTYYFIIRTVDKAQNWSPYSNVAMVAVAPCDAPTSTPGTPQVQTDSMGVLLSWDPPQDPLATSVQVYRGPSAGKLALFGSVPVGEASYHDTTVRSGTTYVYALAWSASCGNGPLGSTASVTIANPNPPAAPHVVASGGSLRVYPNPAPGPLTVRVRIDGAQPQAVRVRLYDMSGHWIADLADGTYSAGETLLTWNRQTRGGSPAAPGYYEALGTIGTTRVREQLVLLP
ncbi:MAG TPA: hypothetical protein VFR25_09180 [Candidatus Eisenbacteria bacterium]|nr:hypothetical protein [Candidatus Eisenbacteria bacterium]